MCGVMGYIGDKNATPFILEGLSKLEYRGYDSAGLAVFNGDEIKTIKKKGRIDNLKQAIKEDPQYGNVGIGHTRWATHGKPSDVNSHPHKGMNNEIVLIHNGIIENYIELRESLINKGYKFVTETDTEVIAHLVEDYIKKGNNFFDASCKTIEDLEGSYALGIMCKSEPDKIVVTRKNSPLIVGVGKGENYIASDIYAVIDYTRDIYILEEDEIAIVKKDEITFFNGNKEVINKEIFKVEWDAEQAKKDGFEHFMLKEINEQPRVIAETYNNNVKEDKISGINIPKEDLKNINKIYIVACGTAYYAGLTSRKIFEDTMQIPVIADIASEFRYNNPIIDKNTLVIFVSQSGETLDTLAALKLAKSKGAKTLAVANVVGSSISREADYIYYTLAGPEISVASTKAFTSQVISLYIIAYYIGMTLNKISMEQYNEFKNGLEILPAQIEEILNKSESVKKIADTCITSKNVFYLGRGLDVTISMEGALKLKEIAYLHAEAYPAGELKHGPLALIEEKSLVLGVATQKHLLEKTISNLKECSARDGKVLLITLNEVENVLEYADYVFYVPKNMDILLPILANVYQQLFAYYMAYGLGNDVDKPRNLAKSVTVE